MLYGYRRGLWIRAATLGAILSLLVWVLAAVAVPVDRVSEHGVGWDAILAGGQGKGKRLAGHAGRLTG